MPKLFVDKSLKIQASAAVVWQVITDPEVTHQWIKEFSPTYTHLDSDWKLGSKVLWKDEKENPDVEGKVTAVEPYRLLRFTVMPVNTIPNWEIKEEDGITYSLTEKDGQTTLAVRQGDFGLMPEHEKYYHMTSAVWDRILPKVKELAEWIEKLEQRDENRKHDSRT